MWQKNALPARNLFLEKPRYDQKTPIHRPSYYAGARAIRVLVFNPKHTAFTRARANNNNDKDDNNNSNGSYETAPRRVC